MHNWKLAAASFCAIVPGWSLTIFDIVTHSSVITFVADIFITIIFTFLFFYSIQKPPKNEP